MRYEDALAVARWIGPRALLLLEHLENIGFDDQSPLANWLQQLYLNTLELERFVLAVLPYREIVALGAQITQDENFLHGEDLEAS